jgi:drug/metabolite transporter (DMT)-like permease
LSAARYRAWGVLFALAGVLAFSVRPILVKLIYAIPGASGEPASAATLLFLRMAIALPFFAAVAFWQSVGAARLARRDWAAIVALGFVGYYLASFLDLAGLKFVGAGVGRLILFVYPTIVLLLSFVFLHKRPSSREVAALAIAYCGIALVVSGQLAPAAQGASFLVGVALVFGSAVAYAVYLVASSAVLARIGSLRFTAWTMTVASLPAFIQFFAIEPRGALDLPASVWGYAALIATFSTVLPVFLVAEALKRIGANHFALIGAAGPVSTALFSAIGLDEPFTALQAAGGVLVVGGVLLVSLRPAFGARARR